MNLDLNIEELILQDCPTSDRNEIAAAIETALTRIFTERGVPESLTRGRNVAHLDGSTFRVSPKATAETIGTQVAQAVYESLTGGEGVNQIGS